MVALQRNQTEPFADARHHLLDDTPAFGSLVDVVADRHDDAPVTFRTCGNFGQTIAEQIKSAVDVRNDVGQTHGLKAAVVWTARYKGVRPIKCTTRREG